MHIFGIVLFRVPIWIYIILFGTFFVNRTCLFYEIKEETTRSTDLSKDISSDHLLLFSTLDGTLTAVDQKEGKILWKHQDEPAVKVPVDTKQAINPIVLPDPKDGSLYLLGGTDKADSLKKLPFTIPELVASSPCRSSDGILYTGKKTDQWFLVEPRSGQREPVLGWGYNPVDTCPMPPGSAVYIGRTQYEILMLELTETKRKWNVTFFGYTAEPMSSDMMGNYNKIHFSCSSTGVLMTMDRVSGQFLWKVDLGSPVVAAYLLTPAGLILVPFTSVASETLPMLEKANSFSAKLRLYPTLYIGEHIHGLYALLSLVDQNTVKITASQTSPLLLEGPGIPSIQENYQLGQNIKPFDINNLQELNKIQNIIMDKNAIIYLGHYNVPDFSPIQLRLSAKPNPDFPPTEENDSNSDFVFREKTRSIEIQTEESGNSVRDLYWYIRNWINKQENKGLKLALIVVFGCLISMFWYVQVRMREFQQLSQGSKSSTGFNGGLANGPVTAYLEELGDGRMRVGKITFTPDCVLGRGCEGTFVYKGEFEGRSVAVKRLLPECFSLADREVSLLKESDAHPHVIRYHCTERDRQFRYIALELCVATLFDYVMNRKQTIDYLPPISEMDILKQATSGIAHLHSLDIVHRDIKPQNVLLWVGRGGLEVRAMISDFGLCKKLQIGRTSFSRRSGITGTEGWIAPEMLNGQEKTTTAVDMFSLGCVYYFVLSKGKHPFGEPLRRQANILSDIYDLSDLQGSDNIKELAKNLIKSLVGSKPSNRPPADAVLTHPLFWSRYDSLTFLQDVSDRVEKADLTDVALQALEKNGANIVRQDWRFHVSEAVAEDLRRYRTYRGDSVRDLLRALRNKKHHYHELPVEAQTELGEIPDHFTDYWTSRFPQLLLHTWISLQCIKSEPAFRRYYPKQYLFEYSLDVVDTVIGFVPNALLQNSKKRFEYQKVKKNDELSYDWRAEKNSPENGPRRRYRKTRIKSGKDVITPGWTLSSDNT